eukprot:scaffold158464_cov49-Attheya_sp.AAC.2
MQAPKTIPNRTNHAATDRHQWEPMRFRETTAGLRCWHWEKVTSAIVVRQNNDCPTHLPRAKNMDVNVTMLVAGDTRGTSSQPIQIIWHFAKLQFIDRDNATISLTRNSPCSEREFPIKK